MDGQGRPHVHVLAAVSFVSRVELLHALQEHQQQSSQSLRVSQWEFSGCISLGVIAREGTIDTDTDKGTRTSIDKRTDAAVEEEEEVEWKVSRVMSHGGAFYE